ncbi:uncharacterized protein UV8b_05825 [Ustilaginoidea virens]|uniref:F-box domain-containing protein n=1 Tax=Ustilaginoidea virens TaxID=1159556 RepID=A0A8E5HU66_USTVR|nr:uncharacterized protein UV8b_05825 [Ustilaginoidea virens]QUC21582.1 hypothetical protein UV8b_05825 [Ustilaginoidea virens]
MSKPVIAILDLPEETQREIVSYCTQGDLICLALVCKHFHHLASSQLYRNFHIVFPDDDDVNFDSPIDGLAGGLDTLSTSEYNYAKHLKDLSMDTLSAGAKGEHSYHPYLYSTSCGKFFNTLLHLTLKRAHSLESFRWNIRVELSRPVYAQLHRIRSLKRLHLRLQAGDSYYTPPPPLPIYTDLDPLGQPNGHRHDSISPMQPYATSTPSSLLVSGSPTPGPPPALLPPSSRPWPKSKAGKKGSGVAEPSTLSGFKELKSLSVLDIDSLDVIPEMAACVHNSFSTLKELQLSLSDALAQQARRPPQDSEVDDSDAEDEFNVLASTEEQQDYSANGPAKIFRAQEERKLQDLVFGNVFGIKEPHLSKKTPMQLTASLNLQTLSSIKAEGCEAPHVDPREEFVASIKAASTRLTTMMNGSKDFSISQQVVLDMIEKAARKYVETDPSRSHGKRCTKSAASNDRPSSRQQGIGSFQTQPPGAAESSWNPAEERAENDFAAGRLTNSGSRRATTEEGIPAGGGEGLSRCSKTGADLLPENVDMGHTDDFAEQRSEDISGKPRNPEASQISNACRSAARGECICESETSVSPAQQHAQDGIKLDPRLTKEDRAAVAEKLVQLHRLMHEVGQRVLELRDDRVSQGQPAAVGSLESELAILNRSAIEVSNEIRILESEIEEMLQSPASRKEEDAKRNMDAYTRKTRGMSLETLKICLVPVKASVLSRAIDVSCIRELTLINVGNQAPIWSMLSKEQKHRPLALRSVFTDHVSAAFLTCMAQLPRLDDLFMLERSLKHKPESFAPRTATSMDQIRRLVLKKHVPTLKRLMIKDESNGPNWDANEKTMILICTRGTKLEELALSFNIHAVHAFMQYFSGLVSLRAINILHFRNNDTCIWVMREILRFMVDNLSHHPELKLEWIAMEDDRVDRVIRPSDDAAESCTEAPTKRASDKGKDKAHASASWGASSSPDYPLMPLDGLDSDSDSEDSDSDSGSRLRYTTVGPLQFYDVWGVKIFEKEIRSGRL